MALRLKEMGVELRHGISLADQTSLAIGGTTDELLLRRYDAIPEVIRICSRTKTFGTGFWAAAQTC